MKAPSLTTCAMLIVAAAAGPTPLLATRSDRGFAVTYNELIYGECKPLIMIYARGTHEPGNMGKPGDPGPRTCHALKDAYRTVWSKDVACQGIGEPYYADYFGNAYEPGTTLVAIQEGKRMFELARTKCPDSKIVGVGYSQGAALITAAIKDLDQFFAKHIVGVVMYGDTKSDQNHGKIPHYPENRVLAICHPGDGVCDGDYDLELTPEHHLYRYDVPKAVDFLMDLVHTADGLGSYWTWGRMVEPSPGS